MKSEDGRKYGRTNTKRENSNHYRTSGSIILFKQICTVGQNYFIYEGDKRNLSSLQTNSISDKDTLCMKEVSLSVFLLYL